MSVKFKTRLQNVIGFLRTESAIWFIGGLVFLVGGILYKIIFIVLNTTQHNLLQNLLPGYWPTTDGSRFKREIVTFLLSQALLFALLFFIYFYKKLHTRVKIVKISRGLMLLGLLVGSIGTIYLSDGHQRLFFLCASAFFLIGLAPKEKGSYGWLSIPLPKARIQLFAKTQGSLITSILGIAVIIWLLIPAYRAWYPLSLPNDYYEIPSSFKSQDINGNNQVIKHEDAQQYLEKEQTKVPRTAKYSQLFSAFDAANGWSQETGRILYHHSYVFVPAAYWLEYGWNGSMVYLYGVGNTIAHALLMNIQGVTLSSYFNIFPIGLLIGLLVMVMTMAYCSKSKAIVFGSAIVGIYCLYQVSFTAALLAFSFSSMRYVGLFIQVASIFFFLRRPSNLRAFGLILACLFSVFWNGEFGLFGLVGQTIALALPNIKMRWKRRLLFVLLLILSVAFLQGLLSPSKDFINSVFLGFFQINMPFLGGKSGVMLVLGLLFAEAVLIILSFLSSGSERLARICLIPIISLSFIKILFNPSGPHEAITFFFIAPLLLLYVMPLELVSSSYRLVGSSIYSLGLLILVGLIWKSGVQYQGEADFMRTYLIAPVQTESWKSFNESLPMALPQQPIFERVQAIKAEMRPDDKVLFLSPFDHLLSFYVNPKGYCGHFELISNVARKQDIDKTVNCVMQSNQNILIVYDKALNTPCANLKKLGLENICSQKFLVKKNIVKIRDSIPGLIEIKRSGDLVFYRLNDK